MACLLVDGLLDRLCCSIIFSDGVGGCFGKSKSDAEWLYRSIDAEAEAIKHSECTIQ